MSDDGLVERVALELAEAHDTDRGRGDSPAADAYRAGSCAVGYWNAIATAAIEAAGVTALTNQVAVLREALADAALMFDAIVPMTLDPQVKNKVTGEIRPSLEVISESVKKCADTMRQALSDVAQPTKSQNQPSGRRG